MSGEGLQVLGIDHVQLAMPHGGEKHARRFWCETMGLREQAKPAHLAINGGCWFEGPGLAIHCGVEEAFLPAERAHLALLVRDLASLVDRLERAGMPYKPGKPLAGYRRGDTTDPFGNRIELMERV